MGTFADILRAQIAPMLNGAPAAPPPGVPGAAPPVAAPPGAAPQANPFAGMMATMPQQGFARPEAQQWMQQALNAPYMQGWGGVPGTPGPSAGTMQPHMFAGGPSVQQGEAVMQQLQNLVKAGTPTTAERSRDAATSFASLALPAAMSASGGGVLGSIGGALGGTATVAGPVGAMLGIAANVIGKYSSSSNGVRDTGISRDYFSDTLRSMGYQLTGGKGGMRLRRPDGTTAKFANAQDEAWEAFVNHVRSTGELPTKVNSHAGTQAYQALVMSGYFGEKAREEAIKKYGTGAW